MILKCRFNYKNKENYVYMFSCKQSEPGLTVCGPNYDHMFSCKQSELSLINVHEQRHSSETLALNCT